MDRMYDGRYAQGMGFQEILDHVGSLIREAGGEALSTRRYNRLRLSLSPAPPTAQAICERLGVSWEDVRVVALAEPATRSQMLGVRAPKSGWDVEDDQLFRVMRAAAFQAGRVLSMDGWDAAVRRYEQRMARHGHPVELPVSATLINRFGSWGKALLAAGLETPTGSVPTAPPAAETLDAFVSETGLIPTREYFVSWCRVRAIPVGRDVKKWGAVVATMRAQRAERGDVTPDAATPLSELPELVLPPNRNVAATREDVLASLKLYGQRYVTAKQPPRARHYKDCAANDPQLIGGTTVQKFGLFQDLCREAGL